tara:strand:- start:4092 stop:4598 length:507 start_codon:yes stop_codon:yes gene_type:complete
MSLKFEDIMSKFYADPKLGIKNEIDEEAPTNNAGSGAVSMPPDAVKKKKKNPYDGRTKEAREFYKRMAERRAKRESKLAKKVQESTLERASILTEDNLDVLRKIVKDKQATNVKFKDGTMKVDMFTASAVVQVFDLVNRSNQQKMQKLINGKKAEFMKISDFALSKVK